MMEYKGYTAKVEFDDEAEIFHGEVIGIRDVVTSRGRPPGRLRRFLKNQWTIIFPSAVSEARPRISPLQGSLLSVFHLSCTEEFTCPLSFPMKVLTHG